MSVGILFTAEAQRPQRDAEEAGIISSRKLCVPLRPLRLCGKKNPNAHPRALLLET